MEIEMHLFHVYYMYSVTSLIVGHLSLQKHFSDWPISIYSDTYSDKRQYNSIISYPGG
jgi:hypothetical protein